MTRVLTALSAAALVAGCTDPSVDTPTADAAPAAAETGQIETTPVSVTKTYELSVPDMSCPYGCYPTVEKTLAGMDGVAGVRLADPEDPEDGTIEDRRVFVDVGEGFDLDAALAKLKEKSFPAEAKEAGEGA